MSTIESPVPAWKPLQRTYVKELFTSFYSGPRSDILEFNETLLGEFRDRFIPGNEIDLVQFAKSPVSQRESISQVCLNGHRHVILIDGRELLKRSASRRELLESYYHPKFIDKFNSHFTSSLLTLVRKKKWHSFIQTLPRIFDSPKEVFRAALDLRAIPASFFYLYQEELKENYLIRCKDPRR